MKIINFSDLHLVADDKPAYDETARWLAETCRLKQPDVVVLTGDIFESWNYLRDKTFDVYYRLARIFRGFKVICVTGNHEYHFTSIKDALKYHADKYNPDKYDVHYLDVLGKFDIGEYRFVGNCLWYDGTNSTMAGHNLYDWAGHTWADMNINEFDYLETNAECVRRIKNNISKKRANILLTHFIPHMELNGHIDSATGSGRANPFNAYSGVSNLFKEVPGIAVSFSGHTHKRVCKIIDGVECYNSGNSLVGPYSYCAVEV